MSKHTPAPWRVSPTWSRIIKADYRPISDDGELIASVHGYDDSGLFTSEDAAEANARLIAAAPELLEALQLALSDAIFPSNAISPAYEKARAAIAKATGDQA